MNSRSLISLVISSIAALLIESACCRSSSLAIADEYVSPEVISISTPVYQPAHEEYRPVFGTYSYTVSWQGIPAATLKVTLEPDGLYYHVVATARTWSGVDLLYKLRYRAEGIVSAIDFLPVKTVIEQSENTRHKYTEINFKGDGEVYALRQTSGEEPKELRFSPNNFMLDPFSAAFLARSLHWSLGDTKEFDTFNGKSRYLISLTAADKKTMQFNGENREVWVIIPKVVNLSNAQQTKKLREARIYVSADDKREVLQLVSEVFIGSVKTTLQSFNPLPNAAAGMKMVRMNQQSILR